MDKKPRILIFSLVYFPKFVGGAEVAIKEITNRLGDHFDFDMVTLRIDKKTPLFEKVGNINVYRVGPAFDIERYDKLPKVVKLVKLISPFLIFFKAVKLHKKHEYNIIWAMMANYAGFAAVFFKMRFPKVKYLLSLQEGDPIEYILNKVKFVSFLFKKIFTKADHVQAISEHLGSFARSMGYKKEVSVIGNGVDVKRFDIDQNIREELGYASDDFVIITASRLVVKNGVADLINSLKYLDDRYKLLVLGEGELRDELEHLVISNDLEDRVNILGYISHDEMPKYFKSADVFARPSLSEGLGNVFLEAMAAKLPVLATEVGGIPDIVEEGVTGMFVNVNDPEDIANNIVDIDRYSDLRDKLIAGGYKQVTTEYEWDHISDKMRLIFNNI